MRECHLHLHGGEGGADGSMQVGGGLHTRGQKVMQEWLHVPIKSQPRAPLDGLSPKCLFIGVFLYIHAGRAQFHGPPDGLSYRRTGSVSNPPDGLSQKC